MVTRADVRFLTPGADEVAASMQRNQEEQKNRALRQLLQAGELESNRMIHGDKLAEDTRHDKEMEAIGKQNADTNEGNRRDQAVRMREESTIGKLKTLLGSGGTGGGEGKPLSSEMQKTSNLIDTARQQLNNTETLAKENPKTAAFQTTLQNIPLVGDPLSNFISGIAGGKMKEIRDSKASTKESLQNVYTGAAASGEQIPAFQGFAGPGAADILKGNVDTSNPIRDSLNSLQQGYKKQAQPLNPDLLKAAGMQNDPIAKQALAQQQSAVQQQQANQLSKLSPQDQELYGEIKQNPGHPNAQKAKQSLERRYGKLF